MNSNIKELFDNPILFLSSDSFDIYEIICKALKDDELRSILIENKSAIFNKVAMDFNIFDIMSLYNLQTLPEFKEDTTEIIDKTINQIFNKDTVFFIRLMNKKIQSNMAIDKVRALDLIFFTIQTYNSEKASILLYNLFLLPDFRLELEKRFKIVEILLEKYQLFDCYSITKNIFKGSSILGCLIKDNNELLVSSYIKMLLEQYQTSLKEMECVGGGSTCLVYRIGKSVIKLGETRNQKQIYVNHRILASQIRKLIKKGDIELFYVEIMKYIKTGDITKQECDELCEDLLKQGLIWEDVKPENCGILDDNDENISNLEVDYETVAGIIENPCLKEQFMKRKRKVVLLDNDNIRRNPKSLWR